MNTKFEVKGQCDAAWEEESKAKSDIAESDLSIIAHKGRFIIGFDFFVWKVTYILIHGT